MVDVSFENLEVDGDVGGGRLSLADHNGSLVVDGGSEGRPDGSIRPRRWRGPGGARQHGRPLATTRWNVDTAQTNAVLLVVEPRLRFAADHRPAAASHAPTADTSCTAHIPNVSALEISAFIHSITNSYLANYLKRY